MKKIAILPTLLTLGNAVCGFAAIACASKFAQQTGAENKDAYLAYSGWLIFTAMAFDALDGYVARLSKSSSDFGMQLDSLCDAISFGLAPAFLLLQLGPGWTPLPRLHQALALIAALYMVCAVLRLARYNIETTVDPASGKRFRGLPSPGAAGCIASLAILRDGVAQRWAAMDPELVRKYIEIWAPLGALAVALLMVSRVPYPHLTKQILRGRKPFSHLVQVIVAVFFVILVWELAFVLIFWLYALAMPVRYTLVRSFRTAPEAAAASEAPAVAAKESPKQ